MSDEPKPKLHPIFKQVLAPYAPKETHTPGPWFFDSNVGNITANDDVVGYASASPCERIANGYMLAAAPELFEACEAGLNELVGLRAYLVTCEPKVILDNLDSLAHAMNNVQAKIEGAIRKARGGKL